jgi:hypothetical protein
MKLQICEQGIIVIHIHRYTVGNNDDIYSRRILLE